MDRTDLPAGTVTLLFTDIEGSTRLLHELGERYAEVLAEHRRVLREAFRAHRGVEVDTQGDAFLYVFARTSDALAAASAAQVALARGPVRVRMGLHTGEPTVTDEGYVGVDVHLAARVMAAGYGGQVLVSDATARAADGAALQLRDLGEHRLKDIERAVHLFQLGRETFPPLKTLNNSNLPAPANPLLGREAEVSHALRLLRDDGARLVTVTGAGGTGKTRFALEVARELIADLPHGAWFVSLAAIRDSALVLPAAGAAVGASVELGEHVGDKRMLLVLDNFEQVVEAAPQVAALLQRCARLQVLVTSREPLAVTGEHEVPLDPLAPEPAVELFRARATAVDPGFAAPADTLGAIAERVDRLPLALELAAARVRALGADELLARLERRLPLLASRRRDAPARQQTLRATIEWSVDLLDEDERATFARLGVFPGSFDLAAAEAVARAGLDDVEALVARSLLRRWESGRFGMLETIRELAAELFERSDGRDDVRRRHAEHYLALAESANLSIDALGRGPQRHELVLPDRHNLRAALDWATEADVELGLRLAIALENLWITEDPAEGMRRLEALLARADGVDPVLRARALRDYAGSAQMAGRNEVSEARYAEALALFRQAGDERGAAEMTFRIGVSAFYGGDYARGRRLHEDALESFRRLGDVIGELQAMGNLGWFEFEHGDRERGWGLVRRSLELGREAGWAWWEAGQLAELADRSLEERRPEDGERYACESLEVARQIADRATVANALALVAWAAALRGDHERARSLWAAVEREHELRPMARWAPERERYAGRIPDGRPRAVPTLDEAVALALGGERDA